MLLRHDGALASSVCQYIDDLRTCAKDEATAWKASSRIAKTLGWLGLQDAARKRREPSQSPGAWSGATVVTLGGNVFQSVTPERWFKTQMHIRWLASCVGKVDNVSALVLNEDDLAAARSRNSNSLINHKRLESCRGFLVYVSNTYRAMIPFLKGIHLTVDSWRPDRDDDGWRLPPKLRGCLDDLSGIGQSATPPQEVKAAARLEKDLEALMDFTAGDEGPLIPVRSTRSVSVYMVGDASGTGFGGSTWKPGADAIDATFGAWDTRVSESESSNFREALNLVMMIERKILMGDLDRGSELFVFTDNSTAERAFNKGASSVKKLHELVVRVRKMEMLGHILPRFVWISGDRMIAQGTDGLSRGDLNCGVMGDGAFLKHIPLNRSVLSYESTLKEELISWMENVEEWLFLTEEGWFDEVFRNPNGKYVWTPSASLARIAVEQLCEVKHIHPYTSHIFLAPALMTNGWRKLLGKQSDAILTLPVGPPCWPSMCYEPLVLSLTCPLMPRSPWIVRNDIWVGLWMQELQEAEKDAFPVLAPRDLEEALMDDAQMEEDEDPSRFREGREGDHLLCSFQCDWCHFLNMQKRLPEYENPADELLLMCIRRANLDAFWSRERSTVSQNRREGIRFIGICRTLGLSVDDAYPPRGPFAMEDSMGMKLACVMLVRSLDAGKNAKTVQFHTMRKLRSHISNFSHSCPGGVGGTFVGEDSNASTLSHAVSNTPWFRRFIRGCHRRMGDVWLPDRPVLILEIKGALEILEEDWVTCANDPVGQISAGLTACLIISGFFAALRGEEIVRIDVGAMIQHWDKSYNYKEAPHVPLMLVGRFKREIGEKVFTQPLAHVSMSGVTIMIWFWRTLGLLRQHGRGTGALFKNEKNRRASVAELDTMLHAILKRVQLRWPNLIPDHVKVQDEYSSLRSFRRGATAEAQNAGIPEEVIQANNRWRKHCRSRGSLPSMSMMERYTDAKANVKALIRFSGGL